MSKNNGKLKGVKVQPAPVQVLAKLTVEAYANHPPRVECTADAITALKLLVAGFGAIINSIDQRNAMANRPQADQVDKPRQFLGPREDKPS